jgi:Aspartyl/Asparaginyl beta-hydroxylase
MNDRFKLPLRFDPERLAADLARLEDSAWVDHFVTQNYEGVWSALPLRGPAGESHPIRMIYPNPTCRDFVDTPLLELCPYFREVLAAFGSPLEAVRLMKLAAGSSIKEHSDHALAFEQGTVRLHIPVVTNPGVEFYLNRERVVMNAGECWYLRLSDPHSAANRGEADRVHMVIDAEVDEWMREMLTINQETSR